MRFEIDLKTEAGTLVFDPAETYEEGSFFAIDLGDRIVKYPIANISKVVETVEKATL